MSKCFFTELEFKTKTEKGEIVEEKKVMFHDERSGFVGIASDSHKQSHPAEYQEFLALSGKVAKPEEVKPVDGSENDSAFDKNAMMPVDEKAEDDLSEIASEEQTN